MKRSKRLSIAVMAAVLAAGMISCSAPASDEGSSSKADVGSVEVKFPLEEPVTMTMFAVSNNGTTLPETLAFKEMEKQTGVKWEVQSVTGTDLLEKRNLLLNSNQYPDVFMKAGLDQQTIDTYGQKGIFLDLTPYLEKYAPNFSKILDSREDIQQQVVSGDGKIYAMPHVGNKGVASTTMFINQAWLDKLNLEMPTSLDEYYNVLKAFKTQDPNGNGKADEIPLICCDATPVILLMPYFGVTCNNATMTAVIDGKYQYVPSSDIYKEFIAYMTKLYSEGLLDANSFTQKLDQVTAIGTSGDTLGCFFNAGAFLTVGRERDEDFPYVPTFEDGVFPTNTGAEIGGFAITDACKNPEVAVAWVDQWYSEEGGRLAWMGMENDTYKVNDDGSWDWVLGDYKDTSALRIASTIQGAATHPGIIPEIWTKNYSDKNEAKVNREREEMVANGAEPFPSLKISEKDNKTLASIKADIDPYVNQYIAQVVTGQSNLDETWDEYLATLNNMGLETMMDIYTKAYNEATGK